MNNRQQRTIGAIIKIILKNGYHTYGRILDKGEFAFYDIKTKEDITDLNYIISQPILFIIAVYDDVITSGHWLKIGKLPLEESLKILPNKFIQDAITKQIQLYHTNTGEITPSSAEECDGLEYAAAWEANHVEERIEDYYNGKPNIWVEKMKIKK